MDTLKVIAILSLCACIVWFIYALLTAKEDKDGFYDTLPHP